MMVRCIDNFLQSDVLTEGRLYEVLAERDDCYALSGLDKPMSKVRFEPVTQPQASYEMQGTGYDSGAVGYESQGRKTKP